MKDKIKRVLQKWPFLYRLAVRIYEGRNPYRFAERFVGTKAREWEWKRRHQRKGNDWNTKRFLGSADEWVLSYWDSQNHSHRPVLIERIAKFAPISSILEIGCNCGPNLYLVSQRFPGIDIQGIDINPVAIQKGNELFTAQGIKNVKLSCAKADELSQFPDKSFDVVFVDAVLIYIGRDKIKKIIQEMCRVARKGVVLLERNCIESSEDTSGLGVSYHGLWHRNYLALFKQLVPEAQVRVTKVTEDIWPDLGWQEAGAIFEVVFNSAENHLTR